MLTAFDAEVLKNETSFYEMYFKFLLFQLSTIGRCEYEKTCTLLIQLFDQSAQEYQKTLPSSVDMAIQEGENVQLKPHLSRLWSTDF